MNRVRTCNGCRALYIDRCHHACELGFEIERVNKYQKMGVDFWDDRPKCGVCPKPKTYKELFDAYERNAKRRETK